MDSEAKFWVLISSFVALAFVTMVFAILAGTMNANRHYYATVQECMKHEGTWVPTRESGTCIRR